MKCDTTYFRTSGKQRDFPAMPVRGGDGMPLCPITEPVAGESPCGTPPDGSMANGLHTWEARMVMQIREKAAEVACDGSVPREKGKKKK